MKILAIMGSPRKEGNTYKLTRKVEERMKQLGAVEFEYVFLRDLDLKPCRGCGICFDRGEDLCPLKDDRAALEKKMLEADGVIFASPTYVFNVTGLMKNFLDRFGYACHRPRFFKSAMIVSTSGLKAGTGLMQPTFSLVPRAMGFRIAHSLHVVTNGLPEYSTPEEKVARKVDAASKKFYKAVAAGAPRPSVLGMALFLAGRQAMRRLPQEYFDYQYYRDHGWFEKEADYYYGPRSGMPGRILARLLSKLAGLVAR